MNNLKEIKENGTSSENGFIAEIWRFVFTNLEDPKKTDSVCSSKYFRLKKDFKQVKYLCELSGMDWSPINKIPGYIDDDSNAEDAKWKEIEKIKPECIKWKTL